MAFRSGKLNYLTEIKVGSVHPYDQVFEKAEDAIKAFEATKSKVSKVENAPIVVNDNVPTLRKRRRNETIVPETTNMAPVTTSAQT